MKNFYFCLLSIILLCASPGIATKHPETDVLERLVEVGLEAYAKLLAIRSPNLVKEIGQSKGITLYAPRNDAVYKQEKLGKRGEGKAAEDALGCGKTESDMTGDTDPVIIIPGGGNKRKRKNNNAKPHRIYSDTNFEKIFTFLDDPEFINLGEGQVARIVKNYAGSTDGGINSPAPIEVTSGLGDIQTTLRGPFKFKNGVIYEVTDFFTLPQTFTTTMQHLNISQEFYDAVVNTGNLELFEKAPAITIFAPVDCKCGSLDIDPESYILWNEDVFALFLTPDLRRNAVLRTKSGSQIKITRSDTGDQLVNCRRIVKPNVITKNGVIHFIDGPLYGPGTDCKSA